MSVLDPGSFGNQRPTFDASIGPFVSTLCIRGQSSRGRWSLDAMRELRSSGRFSPCSWCASSNRVFSLETTLIDQLGSEQQGITLYNGVWIGNDTRVKALLTCLRCSRSSRQGLVFWLNAQKQKEPWFCTFASTVRRQGSLIRASTGCRPPRCGGGDAPRSRVEWVQHSCPFKNRALRLVSLASRTEECMTLHRPSTIGVCSTL